MWMTLQPFEMKIAELIKPTLQSMGYDLVRVKLMDKGARTLQIMAERASDRGMSIEDCTKISHTLSALFDVEDVVDGEYNLEVSSPGMDRPLARKEDFVTYKGYEIKLTTLVPVAARKKFQGTLIGMKDGAVALWLSNDKPKAKPGAKVAMLDKQKSASESEEVLIPLEFLQSAKLVITDAMLKSNGSKLN